MGTLFEQLPQGQIRPKAEYFCANQIANDKTIILSTENVQKVHSRPKLWGFGKRCGEIGQNATGTNLAEIQKCLCPSDSQLPDDRFEP